MTEAKPKTLTFPKNWKNKTAQNSGKTLGMVGVHHAKNHAKNEEKNEERETSPHIAKG